MLVIKANQRYVPGNTSIKSDSIHGFEPCVFNIRNRTNQTSGSGFLCKIQIDDKGRKGFLVGLMTCAHVMPDVGDDIKPLENYVITFERGLKEDTVRLDQCVLRAIKMPEEQDALFLIVKGSTGQLWLKNLRVGDVVDTQAKNVYSKGRPVFSLGHPSGGLLKVGPGNIGSNGDNDVLVPHSMDTDNGSSGAPIIDLQTEKFIAIHKGDLDLSKCTHDDKESYPNCAVKIIPVIKYIQQYYQGHLGPSYLAEADDDKDLDRATPKFPDDKDAVRPQIKKAYHEIFRDHSDLIAQNINFGVKYSTIPRLISAEVLTSGGEAHKKINMKNSDYDKGIVLVEYLIQENDIKKYDAFIVIWSDVLKKKENQPAGHMNQAEKLRFDIDEKLKNDGLERF